MFLKLKNDFGRVIKMLLSYDMLRKSQIEISELRSKTGYNVISSE